VRMHTPFPVVHYSVLAKRIDSLAKMARLDGSGDRLPRVRHHRATPRAEPWCLRNLLRTVPIVMRCALHAMSLRATVPEIASVRALGLYRGLAEMSGQALCFRMISSRRPDTGKCPRHIRQ